MMIIKYCIYTSFNDHHQENIDGQTKINNNKIIESKNKNLKKKMPTGHLCVCVMVLNGLLVLIQLVMLDMNKFFPPTFVVME